MHVSTNRWRLKALGLAAALAMALTPATALAVEREHGTFDDTPVVTCIDADGNESRHECTFLDESAAMPIEGGWWLLEGWRVRNMDEIEVTGDTHFVIADEVDLKRGRIHVNEGASLDLYKEKGCPENTQLYHCCGYTAIENDGTLGGLAVPARVYDRTTEVKKVPLPYLDEYGFPRERSREKLEGDLCNGASIKEGGDWYYVSRNLTLDERMEIKGDVTMVICDGATLTCKKGIHLPKGTSLTIHGQSGRSGKIVAEAGKCGFYPWTAIGGNYKENAGNLNIYDVSVVADVNNGTHAAAIGSCVGSSVIFRRAHVEAKGGMESAGIGGGGTVGADGTCNGGYVVIENSEVTAIGGDKAAGIGGGYDKGFFSSSACGNGGEVLISGNSKVDAKSESGAAIGRAEDGENPGTVALADNLRVVDLDNGEEIAPFDLRGEYCKYRNHVRVEPGESK